MCLQSISNVFAITQLRKQTFPSIILIYKLRKLSMLFPTSSSLTKMNLANRAAISSPWCSRFYCFFSLLINLYVVR